MPSRASCNSLLPTAVKVELNGVPAGDCLPSPHTIKMKGVFVDGYPPPSSVEMNGVHVNDFIPASPPTLVL